ncbi:MAG: type 4a pilus biogenesis protein PilO [Rubrobacter sp.]|nr:type 4a pilus biogenesis protein PilO [Rubrobacteraceae bacterium]MDQ3251437.1 type 4a pilus biogenesis protein PilO [Actinomycetota bacterium]MDQ3435819.1 type 4a pilus biogenesis protein PilO [Actinomycetota bacterium]
MSRNDRNILILGLLGILIIVIGFYFLLLSPLLGTLNDRAKEREDKQVQLDQLQQQVNELEEVRRNSPEIERQLLELSKRVPTQPQIPTFVVQIEEIAGASGVTQLVVEPGDAAPPAGGGDYQTIPVTMQFNGTYDEMQDFLLRTRNLARLVTVTDVSYCREPEPIDDEHSCPVQPPEEPEESTTADTSVESPLLVEIQAEVYFQPQGVPSGAETTAPTPSESTTPAEEATGG